ncbi:hypothetical protein GON01_05365 [Sphingomonas sp. MAH-20]|jgi:hypothetical protein|uniref:Uncharacterized protein n=1 Tax=Sphingomonas horti TaxID=2682842 RepID=A0A6I4IYZ3_9SPHN|nr:MULTISPECIES: hypothetical protein [Sphingomonas]MBA2918400.1 hypothetical protein [Sphingomonas sp. CGMCC 1.13658]MVO77367.1 hypothetical protein [Sphingomonas horti]
MIDRRLPRALRACLYENADPATDAEAELNAAVADLHALIAAEAESDSRRSAPEPRLLKIIG